MLQPDRDVLNRRSVCYTSTYGPSTRCKMGTGSHCYWNSCSQVQELLFTSSGKMTPWNAQASRLALEFVKTGVILIQHMYLHGCRSGFWGLSKTDIPESRIMRKDCGARREPGNLQ